MIRSQLLTVLIIALVAHLHCSHSCADDAVDDAVQELLKAAEAKYDADMRTYRLEVESWFDKAEKAARKSGSEIAEKVQAIAEARRDFRKNGSLPQHAPASLISRKESAAEQLVRAMDSASNEYSRQKMDAQATAVLNRRRELVSRIGIPSIHPSMLRGTTWDMGYRSEGVDHFLHRIVLASDGTIQGSKSPNESTWEVRSGKLVFRHANGQTTTVFHRFDKTTGKPVVVGIYTLRPGVVHHLTQVLKD